MAPNPNPARITEQQWWFVEQCLALAPGSRYGGTITNKPGSHNTRAALIGQGLTNDYSIRDPRNRGGPSDKTAAFDWTFPDAQAGNYTTIIKMCRRVDTAYWSNDPRLNGWFEVLGQADADSFAEGWMFYPTRRTRTPDPSHLWHIHFGWLRDSVLSWPTVRGMISILKGETLATYTSAQIGATMATVDSMRTKLMFELWAPTRAEYIAAGGLASDWDTLKQGGSVATNNDRPGGLTLAVQGLQEDMAAVKADVAEIKDLVRALAAPGNNT